MGGAGVGDGFAVGDAAPVLVAEGAGATDGGLDGDGGAAALEQAENMAMAVTVTSARIAGRAVAIT
jgi:hypothetical protein